MHLSETRIVANSISAVGKRLTTFQLRYWRPIHAELMTHRAFGRNAGSSRARPTAGIRKQVWSDPWGPLHWGLNQPGMQAHTEATGFLRSMGIFLWCLAAKFAVIFSYLFEKLGFHKQIVNRILEPFTYIDVVLTATEFNNWWALRDHPDADPMIQQLAKSMRYDYDTSTPQLLQPGEWHLPFIFPSDWDNAFKHLKVGRITRDEPPYEEQLELIKRISTARCARTSYKAFDGFVAAISADLGLFDKLLVSRPLHASPAEHQATPDEQSYIQRLSVDPENPDGKEEVISTDWEWDNPTLHGNLVGWIQFRKTLPNEFVPG